MFRHLFDIYIMLNLQYILYCYAVDIYVLVFVWLSVWLEADLDVERETKVIYFILLFVS